uniref:Uncharacterized protein n=1 Tax=Bactrocera latifrons TaxID=174628 RepID=A0A0K8TVQ9_BACLA
MCECCHSCSQCDSYARRRCASCSSTYLREPSSVKSCCRHNRWTCPCCCKKYFRSHSVCGLFSNNKCSGNDEYKLYERHLTGHYLKMKSTSVTDLYSTYDLSKQKASAKEKRRSCLCNKLKSCRKSRRDTHEVIPGCSPRILQRLDVDYESYKSMVEIPLTYCPTCQQTQYNDQWHTGDNYRKHQYHMGDGYRDYQHQRGDIYRTYRDYLERLKRSIYSFKDTAHKPNEVCNNSFLSDLNKLYATVGGGIEGKPKQRQTDVSLQIQTQTPLPNPIEAMREYRAFFGRGNKPRRYSNRRRSHSYRRRSRTPSRASSINFVDVPKENWPVYSRMRYSYNLLHQKEQGNHKRTSRRSSQQFSDFVLKYPTQLAPTARVRLSMTSGERHALYGSLLSNRSSKSSVDFDLYDRRHTILLNN